MNSNFKETNKMFWKKEKQPKTVKEDNYPYTYRFCNLYISDKFKQILFVPYCREDIGIYSELNNIIIDSWPCKFQDLKINIEKVLSSFSPTPIDVKGEWPSFENSKAKSQKSFETDYVRLRLETDMSRRYGDGEVERIKVTAQPTSLDDSYSLVGCGHLIDTRIAQIVVDIFEACVKIRN